MTPTTRDSDPAGRVLFLTPDQDAALTLKAALLDRSVLLEPCQDAAAAKAHFAQDPSALLLFDSRAASTPTEIGLLVARIAAGRQQRIPLVALSHTDDLKYRLAAMRAGAMDYLLIPQDVDELADRLVWVLGCERDRPERILVVDAQSVAALFASRVLQGVGMVTERLGGADDLAETLERFRPDLVLMDLHMSDGASGLLVDRMRSNERFASLPLILMSADFEAEQPVDMPRMGHDDFLPKPVGPDRLVSVVRTRLKRARDLAWRLNGPERLDRVTRLPVRACLVHRLSQIISQVRHNRSEAEIAADIAREEPRALIHLELVGNEHRLEVMAAAVASWIRPEDLAARVGERAIAVLIRRHSRQTLMAFAQALSNRIAVALREEGAAASVGAGLYIFSWDHQDALTLLSRAKKAAFRALRNADQKVWTFGLESAADHRGAREAIVLQALHANRLQLLFEPTVALAGPAEQRYEVIPRLVLSDGELVLPTEFVPIAAEAALAAETDRAVLLAALDALKTRMDQRRPAQLFVPQTLAGISDRDWLVWLRDQINDRDLIRARPVLQLEIADADRRLDLAMRRARHLNKLGIKLCLSGVDFSERSTRVLQSVSCAFVRITRNTIHGRELDSIAWLIQSIKATGATVIATGVDTPGAVYPLYKTGVEWIQGPYIQPPSAEMDFGFPAD